MANFIAILLLAAVAPSSYGRLLANGTHDNGRGLLLSPSIHDLVYSWSWNIPCLDSYESVVSRWTWIHPSTNQVRVPDPFIERSGKICFNKDTSCFRSVHDGFISRKAAKDLLDDLDEAHQKIVSGEFRSITGHPQIQMVVESIKTKFKEHHNITHLKFANAAFHDDPMKNIHRHVDYNYKDTSTYVYTALLYLIHSGETDGGATVFPDDLEERYVWTQTGIHAMANGEFKKYHLGKGPRVVGDPVEDETKELFVQHGVLQQMAQDGLIGKTKRSGNSPVSQGLYVFPSPGRLTLFSSGVENVHGISARRPGATEKRQVISFWFDCEDSRKEPLKKIEL